MSWLRNWLNTKRHHFLIAFGEICKKTQLHTPQKVKIKIAQYLHPPMTTDFMIVLIYIWDKIAKYFHFMCKQILLLYQKFNQSLQDLIFHSFAEHWTNIYIASITYHWRPFSLYIITISPFDVFMMGNSGYPLHHNTFTSLMHIHISLSIRVYEC